MTLSDLEFIRLLPHWMQGDSTDIALSKVTDEQIKAIAEAAGIASIWGKLSMLPDAFLDLLADQLHITWYRSDASREIKEEIIRESDQMHMILGTKAAIERIFSLYFGRTDIREWYEYEGTHDHFKILTEDPQLVADYEKFNFLLNNIKRQSSLLDAVYVTMTHEMPIYGGLAVHEVTHEVWDMTKTVHDGSEGDVHVRKRFKPRGSKRLITRDNKVFTA